MNSVLVAPQGDLLEYIWNLTAPPQFHCHCDHFTVRGTALKAHLSPCVRTVRAFLRPLRSCSTRQGLIPAREGGVSFSADGSVIVVPETAEGESPLPARSKSIGGRMPQRSSSDLVMHELSAELMVSCPCTTRSPSITNRSILTNTVSRRSSVMVRFHTGSYPRRTVESLV